MLLYFRRYSIVAFVLLLSGVVIGQTVDPGSTDVSVFEVASVRRDVSGRLPVNRVRLRPGGRTVEAEGFLRSIIWHAYELQPYQSVEGSQPILSERFLVTATIPDDVTLTDGMHLRMLQKLLEDRFGLRVRFDDRAAAVHVLRRVDSSRLGPGLVPRSGNCAGRTASLRASTDGPQANELLDCGITNLGGRVTGVVGSVSEFARFLSVNAEAAFVDETGLAGPFALDMGFNPETIFPVRLPPSSVPTLLPAFSDALRDELGLRYETESRPVPVLIVERVEEPTPN